jgi:hypothetical protein
MLAKSGQIVVEILNEIRRQETLRETGVAWLESIS